MLPWFDEHPDQCWWLVGTVALAAVGLIVRSWRRDPLADRTRFDWAWALASLALLASARWPTWFFNHEFNQDESGFIAGAMTLRHDPMFWRSIDGDTSGPINFFSLLPFGWLPGGDGYLSARVAALLLIGTALVLVHQTILIVSGQLVARICSFSALCLEAFTWDRSFLHYSSELASMPLLAAAAFLASRRCCARADWRWNFAGGLALGALPFAKIQAAPLGLVLGGLWLAAEIAPDRAPTPTPRHAILALITGALAPLLFCSLALTITRQWPHALIPYFSHTTGYVAAGTRNSDLLIDLWLLAQVGHSMLPEWLVGSGLALLLGVPFIARISTLRERMLALSAGALAVVALLCVLAPGRPFLHYCQLLVVPWTLLLGVGTGLALAGAASSPWARPVMLGLMLVAGSGAMLVTRAGLPVRFLGADARRIAQTPSPIVALVAPYARTGESLCVWGWMNGFYVETGLYQATRSVHSEAILHDHGHQTYYRERYLADLQRTRPPVFVDAVAPGSFLFEQPEFRHENAFPALGAYIREHYTLAAESLGNRIYVRNDRLGTLSSSTPPPLNKILSK